MPAASNDGADASNAVIRSSRTANENAVEKSGKEVGLAEVRGLGISLFTDSQGRDLLLILPGSDGFSTPSTFSNATKE